jgi:excisionase family DNA binding protein
VTPELVDLATAARVFGVGVKPLRRLIAEGRIPATKPSRSLLVRLEDVRRALEPQYRAIRQGIIRGETAEVVELRGLGYAPMSAAGIDRR